MKKFALNNSYFKNRKNGSPDTILEIVNYYKANNDLPFNYNGNNWLYDACCERQKKRGVMLDQYLTPDVTAMRIATLAAEHMPEKGLVLDACCGTGQLTRHLLDKGYSIEGFDIDPDMVEVCKLMYGDARFYQMDYSEQTEFRKYKLIVANPPYDIKKLQSFLEWISKSLTNDGKAILLIPVGFMDKERPKALVEVIRKFNRLHTEPMEEAFLWTSFKSEIVVLETSEKYEEVIVIDDDQDDMPMLPAVINEENQFIPEPVATDTGLEGIHCPNEKQEDVLTGDIVDESVGTTITEPVSDSDSMMITHVVLSNIKPNPYNPRKEFPEEDIRELADSIKVHSVVQPVTLRPKDGSYEIVCGERRYRASLIADKESIPAIIRNYSDGEAMEITIIENLQRKDITPVEEANSFKLLMETRRYGVDDLIKRFGKSEKYVRNRLRLLNLTEELSLMLRNEAITIGIALELAKYSHEIQQEVYTSHLVDEDYTCWKHLSTSDFKNRMERAYTTNLNNYEFDKSACKGCPFNTESYNLFAESDCGKCMKESCLKAKQQEYVVNTCLDLVKTDNSIGVCVRPNGNVSTEVVENLKELGFEVHETYAKQYPYMPLAPDPEDYETEEELQEANDEYNAELNSYHEEVAEIEKKIENGEARKFINVGDSNPVLCYVMVDKVNGANNIPVSNPMEELDKKDKRNKEIAVENIVEESKKLVKSIDLLPIDFTDFEDELIYYIMLASVRNTYFDKFGISDKYSMSDDEKFALFSNLTAEQKTLIRREFIIKNMTETFGLCKKSALFLQFIKLHFPEELAVIEQKYNEVYEKRRKSIEEKKKLLQPVDSEEMVPEYILDSVEEPEMAEAEY